MISVVVPCFNERNHIAASVRSILNQAAPAGGLELIVVDGLSNDGTREILNCLAAEYPALRVVDNPQRITPCAMNAGIRAARGRYIAILGAHCDYAPDYLTVCAALFDEHPEAACVGGPIVSKGKGLFGQAVAAAMSHPVGIGNARHRHPNYEGYAEGACFPVFRREIFDVIGLYDETLVRNQDDELNFRLTESGSKVYLSPRARAMYYVRDTIGGLFRQYFQYGYWRVAVLRKHGRPASLRHLVPVTFMLALVSSFVLAVILPQGWVAAALLLPSFYIAMLLGAGVGLMPKLGVLSGLLFPLAAATMHMAYALGFACGLLSRRRSSIPLTPAAENAQSSQVC